MNLRNDAYLTRKYPHVYADRNLPMNQTAMCWGFQCGNGWYHLIKQMSAELEVLIVKWIEENPNQDPPRVSTVKEKWGTLRVYMTHSTQAMEDVITKYEQLSGTTCEVCGAYGNVYSDGWVTVRCHKHAK